MPGSEIWEGCVAVSYLPQFSKGTVRILFFPFLSCPGLFFFPDELPHLRISEPWKAQFDIWGVGVPVKF